MSLPVIDIDEASPADLSVVVDVYTQSFVPMVRGYHPNADPTIFDRATLAEMWGKLLESEPVFLVRQKSDGKPVAVLSLKNTHRSGVIELSKLFVVPEAQSTGVAHVVADFALRFAASQGFDEMELWTWEISHQSRRFYEKVGFVLTDERGISGYPGIRPEDDVTVRYIKQLA